MTRPISAILADVRRAEADPDRLKPVLMHEDARAIAAELEAAYAAIRALRGNSAPADLFSIDRSVHAYVIARALEHKP